MSLYGLPVLFALFVWWFSTGLIIFLDVLPKHTFRWSMLGATAVLAAALYGLSLSGADTSVSGAYTAFTSGLLVWGWLEISFFMGFVTGIRTESCAHGCRGWRHFGHAIQACLYHEIAILLMAAAVFAITWNAPNQVGAWTFTVLWIMRLSSKLNVFLGVRNLNEQFLPESLAFLKSFLTQKPMNALFPFSVTLATIAATVLVQRALAAPDAFAATGLTFVATMLVLAIIEHWFLILPLPFAELWNWSLRGRASTWQGRLAFAAKRAPHPRVDECRT